MSIEDDAVNRVKEVFPDFLINSTDFSKVKYWNLLAYTLHNSSRAIELAKKFDNDQSVSPEERLIITQSLFKDSMMLYSKCFSSAQGKRVRLDINDVGRMFPNQNILEVHKEIVSIRNEYIAHNLENEFEASLVSHKMNNNQIELLTTVTILTPIDKFDKYKTQISRVEEFVVMKINLILDKIQKEKGVFIQFKQ